MANPRQSSFRSILVTRILLLFVPVLLVGQVAALNKARSSLLHTARQNLTESASIKGEKILNAIANLKNNVLLASRTAIVESGTSAEIQEFLTEFSKELPNYITCLQLTNSRNGKIVASTCEQNVVNDFNLSVGDRSLDIKTVPPPQSGTTGQRNPPNQLQLVLSAPVYNRSGQLRYNLSLQSALYQQTKNQPGSLTGNTIVIDQEGIILVHPLTKYVGKKITQHPDATKLKSIIKSAIAGKNESINFSFGDSKELIAGYTTIPDPITQAQQDKWVILAVTSVDDALLGLEEIKLILIVLTVGLIGASLLASLYLAPYLANPVEKLRDYALNIHSHHAANPVPHNFKIREFNQLAQALDQMVDRLKAWSEEIEVAWKEAKTANKIKSQFLATTSHELRNPLNIIINCIRLVKDDLCDSREEELEFLQRADETAIHLLGIINDLLDISKIEAGKLSVVTEPLDLRKILLEVINLQSVNIQQKGLQLKINIGDEVIPVQADAAKLRQVLINIISNATKFTDEGSITISTSVYHHGKSQVTVTITDTGLGIEPAQQHKLFRPFVRIDGNNTRKFEGTGLGLAISRNLIELMGGKITLESAGLNTGTTVKITLPLIDISLLPVAVAAKNHQDLLSLPKQDIEEQEAIAVHNSQPQQLEAASPQSDVENNYEGSILSPSDIFPSLSAGEVCMKERLNSKC